MGIVTATATQLVKLAGIGLAALIAGRIMDHLLKLLPL